MKKNNIFNKYFCAKISKLGILTPFIPNSDSVYSLSRGIFRNRSRMVRLDMVYKIISINKISHTLAKGRVMSYKVVSCSGNRTGWIGLGTYINNKFFNTIELSKFRSIDNIYIVSSNYKVNDIDFFKYKGCKIKFINRIRDKFKLMKVVNSVHSVLGQNRFNLISFYSKNTNVLIKLLLNSLVSFSKGVI